MEDGRAVVANNTALIELFIKDLCTHSSPEEGMHFSHKYFDLLVEIKDFNLTHLLPPTAVVLPGICTLHHTNRI